MPNKQRCKEFSVQETIDFIEQNGEIHFDSYFVAKRDYGYFVTHYYLSSRYSSGVEMEDIFKFDTVKELENFLSGIENHLHYVYEVA